MRIAGRILCLFAAALAVSCSAGPDPVTMLVGTYSSDKGGGIYAFHFDQKTGRLAGDPMGHADLRDASYLTISGDGTLVYAVSERPDSTAALAAFTFDPGDLSFNLTGISPTNGEDPSHCQLQWRVDLRFPPE